MSFEYAEIIPDFINLLIIHYIALFRNNRSIQIENVIFKFLKSALLENNLWKI